MEIGAGGAGNLSWESRKSKAQRVSLEAGLEEATARICPHFGAGPWERPKRKGLRLNPGSKGGSKMIAIGGHWRSLAQRDAALRHRRRGGHWMSDFWRSP